MAIIQSNFIVKFIKPLQNTPKASKNRFATYYLYYKEKPKITKLTYKLFFPWPLSKLILLRGILFDCIVKVITIYYLHYKDKLVSNPTQTFVYNINCLFNFLKAFLFNCNCGICIAKPDIEKLPKIALHLFDLFEPLFFLFNLILSIKKDSV